MSIDISNINWITERPITELYKDNIKSNLDSFTYFLKSLYDEKIAINDKYLDLNEYIDLVVDYKPQKII